MDNSTSGQNPTLKNKKVYFTGYDSRGYLGEGIKGKPHTLEFTDLEKTKKTIYNEPIYKFRILDQDIFLYLPNKLRDNVNLGVLVNIKEKGEHSIEKSKFNGNNCWFSPVGVWAKEDESGVDHAKAAMDAMAKEDLYHAGFSSDEELGVIMDVSSNGDKLKVSSKPFFGSDIF